MSITAVTSQAGGSSQDNAASASRAFPGNVTAGNIIVVAASKGFVGTHRAFIAGDCTKSAGTATVGTITLDKTQFIDDTAGTSGAKLDVGIWSCQVTGSGSCTMAVAGDAATYWVFGTAEFTSSLGSIAVDTQTSSATGTSVSPDSGNVTPTAYDAVLVGGMVMGANVNPRVTTQDGAFSLIVEEENGGAHQTGSIIYRIMTSGTDSASWTLDGSEAWAAAVVAYKEAGVAARRWLLVR